MLTHNQSKDMIWL